MQINKFWIFVLIFLFLLMILDRTNLLEKILPQPKHKQQKYQQQQQMPSQRDYFSEAMHQNMINHHNIKWQQR